MLTSENQAPALDPEWLTQTEADALPRTCRADGSTSDLVLRQMRYAHPPKTSFSIVGRTGAPPWLMTNTTVVAPAKTSVAPQPDTPILS